MVFDNGVGVCTTFEVCNLYHIYLQQCFSVQFCLLPPTCFTAPSPLSGRYLLLLSYLKWWSGKSFCWLFKRLILFLSYSFPKGKFNVVLEWSGLQNIIIIACFAGIVFVSDVQSDYFQVIMITEYLVKVTSTQYYSFQ